MSLLGDIALLISFALVAVPTWWALPRYLAWAARRRMSSQMASLVTAWTGQRTLTITDEGLTDTGSGVSVTVAWDRFTHTTETPDRYVYAADLAIVIDIPKRGELDRINRFAADATQRVSAHSAT